MVNSVTLSTYHVGLPLTFVSDLGLLVAILSPMSVYVWSNQNVSIRRAQKTSEDNKLSLRTIWSPNEYEEKTLEVV